MLHVKCRTLSYFSLVLILCLTLLASPVAAANDDAGGEEVSDHDIYEMLDLFGDVFERVRRDYVEKPDTKKLIEAAINGMLTSLDPHSGYLDADSFKEMQVQTKGEFGGLGIEVTMENGLVKVVSPIDNTPAYEAGIEAGDYISEIDGTEVMGMSLSDAVEKMRGAVGTDITVTILRKGADKPFDVTITRDLIEIKSVRYHAEGDIGYVRITSFSEHTHNNLIDALENLQDESGEMKGLVLDLRNNPGGLLEQAVLVSDAFLDKGEIVSTRERDPEDTQRFSAKPGDLINGKPIVVLINQGSASASEIVAGALKDQRRAVVMGTKSFGKGSVQTVIPLKSHGAMRLTTSRYYTPAGTSIQAKGITPDIVVEPAKIEELETEGFRKEADLLGRLKNEQESKDQALPVPSDDKRSDEKDGKSSEDEESMRGFKAKEDYQLNRALDLLRGLHLYNKATHQQSEKVSFQ